MLLSILVFLPAGCAASASQQRDPHTLVILELADTATIDPLFSADASASLDESLIFNGLAATGRNFKTVPDLATSWHASRDGLHWTVDLRHDVRWSDGARFTSADVTYTWRVQLDPQTAYPYRGLFAYVKSVTALGPYRVRFDLSQTNALFESEALALYIVPEHVLAKTADRDLHASSFGEHPIGTGPYELERWRHDEEVSFTRNPAYYGGAATISRIVLRILINDQARTDAMESGAADIDDTISADAYSTLERDKANVRLIHLPDLYNYFIYTNFVRGGLDDVRVRRAMMYGWDRKALVAGLEHGDAMVETSIVPPALSYWYDPHVKRYPYDPARARRLLDDAGFRTGPDGIRSHGGTRLAYTLLIYDNGGPELVDLAAEFQSDMRAVGIAIDISTVDYATFLERTQAENFDLAFSGWGGSPDPDEETLLGSDQFPPNGNNVMHYTSARVDRDVRLGLTTISNAKRKPYYDDMQRAVAEDVPVLFYEFQFYRAAISRRVRLDYARALPDLYFFRNVSDWTLAR